MKKQELLNLRNLAGLVGDFIRYWGFRRIHGQIWVVIYLSDKPLSGVEIVQVLQVSKALVSPALKELEAEGLILPSESENAKTKRYRAEDDVEKIIKGVLKRREQPLIGKISKSFAKLSREATAQSAWSAERLEKMGGMIKTAQLTLNLLLDTEEFLEASLTS